MASKLKSSILWSTIEIVIKRALDFVVKLILARLLLPEDFGVIGMAAVFISFIEVFNDAGMRLAIIQKQNLEERHLNTVFWTNLVWSIFLYLLLSFVAAPVAASFYSEPILTKVIPVLSISILSNALNTVHVAQLQKELLFKKIALVRNSATAVAAIVAIGMAYLDYGIWALVANDLVAWVVTVPFFYKATNWLPSFQWDKDALKEILSFGLYTTGAKLISNLTKNADYLLIGKWVSASAVGVYTLAYMMTRLVSSQITNMLDRVMYPFYSSIQNDMDKLKAYYLRLIENLVLVIMPIMLTLFLFSDILVPVFFGDKWNEAILPLKILAVGITINALTKGYNSLFRSIGMPKYEFKIRQITSLAVYLPFLVVGIYFYGIIGAATGVLLSDAVNFFIHTHVLKKYFKISRNDILLVNKKIFVISFSLLILVYLLRFVKLNEYVIIGVYVLLYASFMYFTYKEYVFKILKFKR